MSGYGDDPTRADTAATPAGDPTQVGVPPVPPPDEPPRTGGDPGGQPPDRRPWILAGLMALIAVVAVLLLLLDDEDDVDSAGTTTTSTSEATTTSPSTTTTVPSTTTTTAPTTTTDPDAVDPATCAEAGSNPDTPGLAANTVYDAWVRGDEPCARVLMTNDAFEELFSRDGTGASQTFQGCTEVDEPDPHGDCAFTYEGGATHYLIQFSELEGWIVYDIEQVAD